MGIDVGGIRKGLDVVILRNPGPELLAAERRVSVDELRTLIGDWSPDVVTIDSPPGWASLRERRTETFVRSLGLHLYQTPWQSQKKTHPFYAWMLTGFEAYRTAAESGYELFDGQGSVHHKSLEVFPYAIAAVLSGTLRPSQMKMAHWRRNVVRQQLIDVSGLRGPDQVDACLAALTGLLALDGRFCYSGDPSEGVIVLPCLSSELPSKFSAPVV